MLHKKKIKNHYPILVSLVFFIYVSATAFILIFSASIGSVLASEKNPIVSLPYVTTLDVQEDFVKIDVDNNRIYYGSLVLVNNYYSCKFDGEELQVVLENRSSQKYGAADYNVRVNKVVMENLDKMLSDFYDVTGKKNLYVVSGYRSKTLQAELYSEDAAKKAEDDRDSAREELVAIPGYSEHQTGYAVDFSVIEKDGTMRELDNEGEYAWILNNCTKYGFILRYPKDKVEKTQIGYETWHYRYVGVPHAAYIMQNKLCLEEYIELLKKHTLSNPLHMADGSSANWTVYYVPAQSGDKTSMRVPRASEYQICGNNCDGFIVAVKTV